MSSSNTIWINDNPMSFESAGSLEKLLTEFGVVKPYAIVLNNQFIPASKHDAIKLCPNDRIEVISAIQGG